METVSPVGHRRRLCVWKNWTIGSPSPKHLNRKSTFLDDFSFFFFSIYSMYSGFSVAVPEYQKVYIYIHYINIHMIHMLYIYIILYIYIHIPDATKLIHSYCRSQFVPSPVPGSGSPVITSVQPGSGAGETQVWKSMGFRKPTNEGFPKVINL